MFTIRCDKCNAECSAAAVRDGWCENCGKKLPDYLLKEPTRTPAAEPEPVTSGEVVFHIAFRTRLIAFLVLFVTSGAGWFMPIWAVTHPSDVPRKQAENVALIVFGTSLGLLMTSLAFGRLLAGRIVVGERELRHTRAFLGGLGPFVVTDVIPFAAVERFGFGYTPEDTDFFITPAQIPTFLLRAGGADHRFVMKEYDRVDQFLALLLARIEQQPETIRPGWLGIGAFYRDPPGGRPSPGGV